MSTDTTLKQNKEPVRHNYEPVWNQCELEITVEIHAPRLGPPQPVGYREDREADPLYD